MWEHSPDLFRSEKDIFTIASGNRLATDLVAAEPELLTHLELLEIATNEQLYREGDSIDFVYFPVDSLISSLAILEDGTTVEISMVGNEGLAGISAILGSGASRHWIKTSIGGQVLRLSTRTLDRMFVRNEVVMKALLKCYRALITQISQRAVCNARHSLNERFCCWLLMVHDRMGDANLKLTQEMISRRLGSRRAGVTVAARLLLELGAIDYRRGQLHVVNRLLLEQSACECYPIMKLEFDGAATWRAGRLLL
jgi:CRP-like cAMP-binding protein